MDLKLSMGVIEDKKHYYPVRVFYNHTDAGGVVYYANYLRIVEEARVAWFEVLGMVDKEGYEKVNKEGNFVVRSCNIEYYKSANFGDDLYVESYIEKKDKLYLSIIQKVMRGDELLVEMKIKSVFVGFSCGDSDSSSSGFCTLVVLKPRRIPEFWNSKF